MIQDIDIERFNELRAAGKLTVIDVRSPKEYATATVPGALNIPFFDDEERAEVGTLYTQVSVQAAKERGLELASAKLPAFVKQFAGIPGEKAVFCWRGGMRSRTTATVLALMGIRVYRLNGGYREFRRRVVERLEGMTFAPEAVVLHGNTGTGKTAILRALRERGYPVIDLEGLAGHRGSIFGDIGLKANNQKAFDALLLEELRRYENAPYVLLEAESQRIGKIVVPDFLMKKKEAGRRIWLEMPVETRIRNIAEEYRPAEYAEAALAAFRRIKERIHTPIAAEIDHCLREGGYDRAIGLLLVHYYDPLYAHSSEQYDPDDATSHTIGADSVEEACRQVEALLQPYGIPNL